MELDILLLNKLYYSYRKYYIKLIKISTKFDLKFRKPGIPEYISENIIKYCILNYDDYTNFKIISKCKGDLQIFYKNKIKIIECKCFTSKGPISFGPNEKWDILYILDAKEWLNNNFKLYKISLKNTSNIWQNLKLNKKDKFKDQSENGRRPRIIWYDLYTQLYDYITLIYEGSYEDIFYKL